MNWIWALALKKKNNDKKKADIIQTTDCYVKESFSLLIINLLPLLKRGCSMYILDISLSQQKHSLVDIWEDSHCWLCRKQ